MINTLKKMFGLGPKVDYNDLLNKGAIILDVRSKGEFDSGHIKGSINISLQTLEQNLTKLKKDKPIIACCASGMRSSSARGFLASKGYEVYNGGGWMSLKNKLGK
ncbi:MAG: rhodanese-like domain-containing protein [Bacteroidia bacterium]|nr:rhodanese-like domain-containing protein [Bacteroidia bacterium]MBP9688226.1 rhodanese-like domain-containing protein [Bacteroidia bacterium]